MTSVFHLLELEVHRVGSWEEKRHIALGRVRKSRNLPVGARSHKESKTFMPILTTCDLDAMGVLHRKLMSFIIGLALPVRNSRVKEDLGKGGEPADPASVPHQSLR